MPAEGRTAIQPPGGALLYEPARRALAIHILRHRAVDRVRLGRDAFIASPATRWDTAAGSTVDEDARSVTYGAFMQDVELFDNVGCGISPPEVSTMDPQQRILTRMQPVGPPLTGVQRKSNWMTPNPMSPWRCIWFDVISLRHQIQPA